MTSPKFIPKQFIAAPDFKRGTMGPDLANNSIAAVSAVVPGANTRNAIASYSKTAHFSFNQLCKLFFYILTEIEPSPRSTHDTYFSPKDNTVNMAQKP
jgi:hypothetical protein